MIKYMKTCRLHITRFICHKPLFHNQEFVSIDKDGWPKRLLFLKPLSKGSINDKRVLFTLLSITRGLRPTKLEDSKINFDIKPIILPNQGKSNGSIPNWFINEWVKFHKFNLDRPVYSVKNHYLSSKGGPSGKSTWASQWSHLFYKQDLILMLATIMQEGFKELFHTPFLKNMELSFGKDKWPNGKLAIVKDPEGKRRVIAMVDYHSQLALKSIHEDLFKLLNKLKCDRTFTQDPYHNWNTSKELYYSLDLSSATDRFPIRLQSRLISVIYQNNYFGTAWQNLLIDRDYLHPDGITNLRYAVGQPMGAYSSWPAFTLTHHLVVAWCAFKAYKTMTFDQYIILGDDIVIKDNKVAEIYKGQMKRMGVGISSAKTHVSKDTYEFAKRWINNGIEVSGLPMKGIISNYKNLRVVYSQILNYVMKIPHVKLLSSYQIFLSVFNKFPVYNSKGKIVRYYSLKYLQRLKSFTESVRFSFGVLTPSEMREILTRYQSHSEEGEFSSIPNENLIPNYFKGILINGLADSVLNTLKDINRQLDSFERLNPDERLHLTYSGVMYGLKNRIENLQKMAESWMNDDVPLYEIINQFSVTSPDKLSRKDRDISIRLDRMDSLWTKSLTKHFSKQRFPDSYYNNGRLMGSLDALDITRSGIEVSSVWNTDLERFSRRLVDSIDYFISKNLVKKESQL